jgi:hypothetical protein
MAMNEKAQLRRIAELGIKDFETRPRSLPRTFTPDCRTVEAITAAA